MSTMAQAERVVTVGVDTHRDVHVAAVLDERGGLLGTGSFPATAKGYAALLGWASEFGPVCGIGIEGTGSWGAGLARHVTEAGVDCVEVMRPNRQHRRRYGKSDTADAVAAARAVLSGEATGGSRGGEGPIEGLRTNRVVLRSAKSARIQAINQIKSLVVTAPDQLRRALEGLTNKQLVGTVARFRITSDPGVVNTTKMAMRSLGCRVEYLEEEIAELKAFRDPLVDEAAPEELLDEFGVGPDVAASLLITYGANPDRIRNEAALAALCGVSAVDASSGLQQRHRLNRGGDRQANHALWRIVTVCLAHHQPTRDYIAKRISEGKTRKEAIRSLKRHLARRIWKILTPIDKP